MQNLEENLARIQKDLSAKRLRPDLEKRSKIFPTSDQQCPYCDGTEWVFAGQDEEGNERYKPCICQGQRRLERRLRFANLPDAFKDVRLQNFRLDVYRQAKSRDVLVVAVRIIKQYLARFQELQGMGKGLYIYSQAKGSGKTRMAASIANYIIHDIGVGVKFATGLSILDEVKRTWDARRELRDGDYATEGELLRALAEVPVLIIDDFGLENYDKGWVADRFYQLINERYVGRMVTIYTSNMSLGQLKCDERIKDRINERSYLVEFPEESVRKYIAEQDNATMLGQLREGKINESKIKSC